MPSTDKLRTKRRVQHEIYDTFSGLLERPAGGHVLFFPKSKDNHGGAVGDGGYIHKGSFYREFNVYSDPPPGTTPLSLPANGLSTDRVLNSSYAMRSSTSESISLGFEGSSAADVIPDIAPLEIKPEVSIRIRRYEFAFMAYCGVHREVETLLRSQQEKIVEWFIANESAVGPHPLIFVTQTVRSAGWIGGVTIDRRRDLSAEVAARIEILSVSGRASNSRATNIGLVPTHGPVHTTPWSTARSASPNYTVVMSYVMIKRGLKDRLRSMLNGLRTRTAESQDSSKPSPSESTSQSLARTQSSQQRPGSMAPSSSSAGHLRASFSPTTPVALDISHKGAAADDDGSIGSELEDDDEDLEDDEDEGEDKDDDEDNDDDSVLDEKIDNTILSTILDRALHETNADIAVGDWAILKDYADRYGILPDPLSVVLRLGVKDYRDGRTAVEVLSIARDANEPEQPKESVPVTVVLPIGKEVAPPLKPLFARLEIIYARCMGMKQNKKQCLMLYEFCNTIVTAIRKNVENGLSLDDKLLSIHQMRLLLSATASEVSTISTYRKIDAFLKQDAIKDKIYDLRVRLTDCFTVFGITSSLRLQTFADDFTAAAEEDRQVAGKLLARAALAQAEQRVQRMEEQGQRIEQKLDSVLEMGTLSAMDAARLTQIKSRMAPAGSAAEAESLATLRAIQIQSGTRQLPLGDLVNEAQRVGTTAISHSATSELWKGIWLGDQAIPLALKCPRISVPLSPNAVLRFQRSIDILRRIQHRNIMPLLGVKYKPDQSIEFLAFPWIKNGNIVDYLAQNPNADRVKLVFGVACGLAHLHARSPPIVHKAVQPCNILVDAEGEAIISDFGIAKALDDVDHNAHNYTFSDDPQTALRWMAPELSDRQYDLPADAYAWAMTTLQILSGVQPFGDTKQAGRAVINVQQGMRPRRVDHATPLLADEMWSLLERCWQHEPSMRATMVDAVNAIMKMRPDLTVH